MKALFSFILITICCFNAVSQSKSYWQQKVDVNIDVTLDVSKHALDGKLNMHYKNNSPDTLTYIWIHLWPNAYKNDRTAFSDQLLVNRRTDFYFANDDQRGYINRMAFSVNDKIAELEDHPQHQDIIKLILPTPLYPSQTININTDFHVQLPYYFSRSGYKNDAFMITQWYPKPAVYDRKGWHEMPYLDQGEFYSEFGDYNVTINVPKEQIVAATGKLVSEEEKGNFKKLHYTQNNIHDFAWFADKNFKVVSDTLQLPTKTITVQNYYYEKEETIWTNGLQNIKSAIRTKSKWLGEYPYDVATVVANFGDGTGDGMEYPTITLIETPESAKVLDYVINHEVGHNWFYGILASNERTHPWMDEGMNTYYDYKYMKESYGNISMNDYPSKSAFKRNRETEDFQQLLLQTAIDVKKDQPIETPADQFQSSNYAMIAYIKAGKWMEHLANEMTLPVFDSAMKIYYEKWKFKHPYPEDFKTVMEETSGKNLDAVFNLLHQKGNLTTPPKKQIAFTSFASFKDYDKKKYIAVLPAFAYNNYDKLMLGGIIHNYSLPLNPFRFVAMPLYAIGSKQLNGAANIQYNFLSDKKINRISANVGIAHFSTKQSLDTFNNKLFENFTSIHPSIQFHFNHSPLSTHKKWLSVGTYLIQEQKFDNDSYGIIAGGDSSVTYPNKTEKISRYINQISFNGEDHRALYPYDYQLQFEQGKGFYRVNLNLNYFFNYAKGGGMKVRVFASKFGYMGKFDYSAYQYQPKLLAATGEEDYTYSNYFIGRSASTANPDKPVKNLGLAAQQIMIRDGGLKLRLDQSSFLQGRSEDWVAAVNFNSSIPDIFPVKLPLKLFFDAGTYAESWEKNALTSRVLYVGGLQLSLFKNVLNVYAPLIYSKDFRSTLKSFPQQNTFAKRLTFSIDIQNLKLAKLIPEINL